jgi:hypothetical protein
MVGARRLYLKGLCDGRGAVHCFPASNHAYYKPCAYDRSPFIMSSRDDANNSNNQAIHNDLQTGGGFKPLLRAQNFPPRSLYLLSRLIAGRRLPVTTSNWTVPGLGPRWIRRWSFTTIRAAAENQRTSPPSLLDICRRC